MMVKVLNDASLIGWWGGGDEGKGFLGDGNTSMGNDLKAERGGRGSNLGLQVEPSHFGNKRGSHEPSESE